MGYYILQRRPVNHQTCELPGTINHISKCLPEASGEPRIECRVPAYAGKLVQNRLGLSFGAKIGGTSFEHLDIIRRYVARLANSKAYLSLYTW